MDNTAVARCYANKNGFSASGNALTLKAIGKKSLHLSVNRNYSRCLQVIQILLKAKLLTAATDDEAELTPLSTVELFTGYKKYV